MSFNTISNAVQYPLPVSMEAIPESMKSDRRARPINSVLQTVYQPSISGNQSTGGTSVVNVPLGSSSGVMLNPYLTFKVQIAGGTAADAFQFKGSSAYASSLINSIQTFINGQQIDNLSNFDRLMEVLLDHSSSADFVDHEAEVLMSAHTQYDISAGGILTANAINVCIPLPGLLGGASLPCYLLNGVLSLNVNFNSIARAFKVANAPTSYTVSDVALVYDRVQPEQSFQDMVRSQLASGNKYILSYTSYQTATQNTAGAGSYTYSVALNRSSLRAVVMTQLASADLTTVANTGASINNTLTQFDVMLDGRRVNAVSLNSVTQPAICLAESSKCFSRLFDPSVSDVVSMPATEQAVQGGTYLTDYFYIGCSCLRTQEPLAFAGSPLSVLSVQYSVGATAATQFFHFIADEQLAISADGSVELIR